MKIKFNHTHKFLFLLITINIFSIRNYAQDTSNIDKRFFVKITLGAGIGSGYPKQQALGLSGLGEIALSKEKNFISIGTRGITEFDILAASNVTNSLSTAEVTYGRLFQKNKIAFIAALGVSYITFQEKGAIIPRNTGFQLFSSTDYEKVNYYSIGLPISLKLFFDSKKKRGWLFEIFGNINNKIPLVGFNIANQFILYKTKRRY
jgi:hypothetical protein